jgi:hypothetical protein
MFATPLASCAQRAQSSNAICRSKFERLFARSCAGLTHGDAGHSLASLAPSPRPAEHLPALVVRRKVKSKIQKRRFPRPTQMLRQRNRDKSDDRRNDEPPDHGRNHTPHFERPKFKFGPGRHLKGSPGARQAHPLSPADVPAPIGYAASGTVRMACGSH